MDEKQKDASPDAPTHRAAIPPQTRKLYDNDVTLEEYRYYAKRTREEQRLLPKPKTQWSRFFGRKDKNANADQPDVIAVSKDVGTKDGRAVISDEEWTNASRAFRTASTGAVFYLVR